MVRLFRFTLLPLFTLLTVLVGCQRGYDPLEAPSTPQSSTPEAPARTMAVTIDDLPTVRARTLAERQAITEGLLKNLKAYDIPAIGFVNEAKLGTPPRPGEVALLQQWLDAGQTLGNHTFSHPSLFQISRADFQADVLRGEAVTRPMMAAAGDTLRYFRHPYLNTGPDLETKSAFESFLTEHAYTVAPVTIDNDEYLYAQSYDFALRAGDQALADSVAADYLRYMEQVVLFFEKVSRDLLGREPAQVLLLHANRLNAHHLGALAQRLQARGYRFISLDEALLDPAYQHADMYTGRWGFSWLERWWITEGHDRLPTPDPPAWVTAIEAP